MSNQFNADRAKAKTIAAIDLVADTMIHNRSLLGKEILRRHPEASTPEMGDAAVNMALNLLSIMREALESAEELYDAADRDKGVH